MHPEILSKEQLELLPFLGQFNKRFFLVGGTSIALQIGHRRSIDFDLFCAQPFSTSLIHKKVVERFKDIQTLFRSNDQVHYLLNGVKVTFFYYPFQVPTPCKFEGLRMPNPLSLAAMKAFALGRRAKWKDYVDLYILLKCFYTIDEISDRASVLFASEFNRKLFKQQLIYFNDIDFTEQVVYMPGFEVTEEEVKNFLIEIATEPF